MNEIEAFHWFMPGDPPDAPSLTEGCWDWSSFTSHGYGRIHVSIDGRQKQFPAHVVSHRIYNGPVPDGLAVLHSCDRRICVQPRHLGTGTWLQNSREMVERGRSTAGERCSYAKLTDADVIAIRQSSTPSRGIAVEFGISATLVRQIRRGEKWTHLLSQAGTA